MADSLLTTQGPESSQKVQLHPLVLLTASDLITRHRLRNLEGPVVGFLLGQQEGTKITAEYAFTAKIKDGLLDHTNDWTTRRIEQYKEVHKNPVLEVVGWFTLCPETGPLPAHVALHKQLSALYAENAIMLAIHPEEFKSIDGSRGKLPISVYESAAESDNPAADGAMQVDGKENAGFRFRSVPFSIETEESEMIAINYVAKGAGSAAAVSQESGTTQKKVGETSTPSKAESEEKDRPNPQGVLLTPEEEDEIAGMTTRLNSVKMLQQRLQIMSKLVQSMPPSYISDQSVSLSSSSPAPEYTAQLRNIQALLSRLSLLTPAGKAEAESLTEANRAQANDVNLASILSMLGQEAQSLSELGRKFSTVEQARTTRNKNKGGFNQGAFGTMDDYATRSAGINEAGMLMM